jgi:hypothetical protein
MGSASTNIKAGLEADESEFVKLDAGKLIAEAKSRRKKHGTAWTFHLG